MEEHCPPPCALPSLLEALKPEQQEREPKEILNEIYRIAEKVHAGIHSINVEMVRGEKFRRTYIIDFFPEKLPWPGANFDVNCVSIKFYKNVGDFKRVKWVYDKLNERWPEKTAYLLSDIRSKQLKGAKGAKLEAGLYLLYPSHFLRAIPDECVASLFEKTLFDRALDFLIEINKEKFESAGHSFKIDYRRKCLENFFSNFNFGSLEKPKDDLVNAVAAYIDDLVKFYPCLVHNNLYIDKFRFKPTDKDLKKRMCDWTPEDRDIYQLHKDYVKVNLDCLYKLVVEDSRITDWDNGGIGTIYMDLAKMFYAYQNELKKGELEEKLRKFSPSASLSPAFELCLGAAQLWAANWVLYRVDRKYIEASIAMNYFLYSMINSAFENFKSTADVLKIKRSDLDSLKNFIIEQLRLKDRSFDCSSCESLARNPNEIRDMVTKLLWKSSGPCSCIGDLSEDEIVEQHNQLFYHDE